MKKLFVSILVLTFLGLSVFSQAVNDKAVIPVSVNLNQILRLNIVSGGNIEFTFNTIDDYTTGLSGAQYRTTFTVTSSVDYDVVFSCESATMTGTDNSANTIGSGYVALAVTDNGGGAAVTVAWQQLDALNAAAATLIDASPAGDATAAANQWVVDWICGDDGTNTDGSLLGEPADRYAVNTFITVVAD